MIKHERDALLFFGGGDRCTGLIGRGTDEWRIIVLEEEDMEGSIGEHDADGIEFADRWGLRSFFHQYNRAGWGEQNIFFGFSRATDRFSHGEIATEDSVGFTGSLGERVHLLYILFGRRAHEVKPADAFNRDDCSLFNCVDSTTYCFIILESGKRVTIFVKSEARSAVVTGDGLGMEAPVSLVGIFFLALFTHNEVAHGGRIAIIGTGERYGETRTALCTGGEEIPVSTISDIRELSEAGITQKEVGWYFGKASTSTLMNRKIGSAFARGFAM